ncbi:MAG TPA: tandem-95 repeat protein [Solirubrobacterales bacterium]|nr:tandem-95 repeat protein [Solirubrobacterales bacterium]
MAITASAGTFAEPADALGPEAAKRSAMEAFGAGGREAPRALVFSSSRPLPAGEVVRYARLRGGTVDTAGVSTGPLPLALRAFGDEPAWLFYEDRTPYIQYEHSGRIAVVGVRSGDVELTELIDGPPVINGLPARFLGSRIFFAPRAAAGKPAAPKAHRPLPTPPPPASAAASRAAAQLSAERTCFLRAADTLGGADPYRAIARSGGAVGRLAARLSGLGPGLYRGGYRPSSGVAFAVYMQGQVDAGGCREVSLYLAGGGYQADGETTIAVGVRVAGDRLRRYLVSTADLQALLRSRPTVWWNLTVDAPHAGALLEALRGEPNLASAQTSGGPRDPSLVARRSGASNREMLSFTRRLLSGLNATLADDAAVSAALADRQARRAPTFLSALLARGFESAASSRGFASRGVEPQSFLRAGVTGLPGLGTAPLPFDDALPPPVNKAPTIAASVAEVDYAENGPTTPIDPGMTVADADSSSLSGASIRIASGYVNGEDLLEFTDDNGIAGSWDPPTGVLTLSGTASVSDYEDALRSVGYLNASDAPAPGPRPIEFRVDDGIDESAAATIDVDVAGENDAPEAQLAAGSASYAEDAAATPIDPTLTVVDPDSANLASATVKITTGLQPAEDRLGLSSPAAGITAGYDEATGTLTLTGPAPKADFQTVLRAVGYNNVSDDPDTGTRTVSVTLTDADGATGAATSRNVTVTAVNDAPVVTVAGTELDYDENDPATAVDPTLTVTDADSAQLSGATVTVASGYLNGADELGFADAGAITGSWNAANGVLTLSGNANVAEYQAALRTVTYRNLSDNPVAGPRSIAFRANDGGDEGDAATLIVDVAGDNDAPDLDLPATGAVPYTENDPATAIDSGAVLTDPDSPSFASATVKITTGLQAAEDRLELITPVTGITASYDQPTGTLTLTGPVPIADLQTALRAVAYRNVSDDPDSTTRTVTFEAKDSDGASTPVRSRQVEITETNDAPTVATTATPLPYSENDPDTVLDAGLTVTDLDSANLSEATVQVTAGYVEGEDFLSYPITPEIGAAWEASTGTLTLTGTASRGSYEAALRTVTYRNLSDDPAAGPRTVTVEVDDGVDASAPATRTIQVSVSNDGPEAELSSATASFTENAAAAPLDGALTVEDPDSTTIASATVAITAGLQAAEDSLGLTAPVAGIDASYASATGVLTLTGPAPIADFQAALRLVGYLNTSEDPETAARTVSYSLTDSEGVTGTAHTLELEVIATNDTPVAASDDIGSTDEATVLTVNAPGVLGNDTDPDGDPLVVAAVDGQPAKVGTAVTTAKGASVTVNADGSLSYDPSGSATLRALGEGDTDTDTFTYAAGDGSASATATVTVTVIGLPDPPIAGNDSYNGVGNTTLTVGQTGPSGEAFKQLSGSVLDNDTDADTPHAELTVEATTTATSEGGSATIAADGKFTYTPPAGITTAIDSFEYTVSDGEQEDTGTVQISLSGRVWYVDNDRPSSGDGRSSSPFDTLAAAASASSAGDTIYVHKGDGTTTKQNAGIALKANQRLLGEATDLVVGADTLFDGAPAQRSKIGNSAGVGVTLASGSRVEGLDISAAGGRAISGGAGVVGSTIGDVLAGGSAGGVGLIGTSGTFEISNLAVTTTGGTGLTATNAGDVRLTSAGTISISSTGGMALDASGSELSGTIDSLSVPSSSAGGVFLQNTTGSIAFGDVSITTSSVAGFFASSAAGLSVSAAGTANVSSTGAPALDARTLSSPTLAFDNLSSTNSPGAGINVDQVGGTVSGAGGTVSGAAGAGVDVNGGAGTVSYAGTIGDGLGRPAEVTGRTGGAVTISGNISEDDTGISVSGNSGGSTEFSGASKSISTGAGNAVNLSSNSGHTVNFTGGGLALTTTSGKGFLASGGGTVTVQGSGNTIASTTGTALDVQNTTIGANDLSFRSIAANGGANGIVLNTTGSSGGLIVTGNGTADSGGVIQNVVGADGTTAGVGAYLNSTKDVSLARMRFTTSQGHAIRGSAVNGFALSDSTVNGTNGTNDAVDEGSVALTGLTGTASITDTTIQGGIEDNLDIITNGSGTLNLVVTGLTLGPNSTTLGGNGFLLVTGGSSNVTTTVSESHFTSSREDLFQHVAQDKSTSNITVTENQFNNGQTPKVGGGAGILLVAGGGENADLTYKIANNSVRGTSGPGIFVQKAVGISKARGRITGNAVGVAGVVGSASEFGSGIDVEARGQGSHVTAITNNTVRNASQNGFAAIAGEDGVNDNGTVSIDVTATGNTVAESGPKVGAGFRAEVADDKSIVTFCLDLLNNQLAGGGPLGTDIRVFNDWPQTVFRLPGYAGGALDQTAVTNYFKGRNTATTTFVAVPPSGNGFTTTSACTQPPA